MTLYERDEEYEMYDTVLLRLLAGGAKREGNVIPTLTEFKIL